jgi:mannose-6-phosphate isomerase-like protein (cupin superfamily)
MSEATKPAREVDSYPYETHLDVRFAQLTKFDLHSVIAAVQHPWFNQTLCRVNDAVLRVGVIQGEYHWHKHDNEDELFFVLSGRLIIDLDPRDDSSPGTVIELTPYQGFAVPKGVVHRTRAPEKTVILMIENAGIKPTGDA